MLKSCKYCGRIHDSKYDCGKRPRKANHRHSAEQLRYTSRMKKKSEAVKAAAHYLCEYHLFLGQLVYTELETHHIIKLQERQDLALEDSNLICLCRNCHEKAEKGEISPQLLRKIALNRGKQSPRLL